MMWRMILWRFVFRAPQFSTMADPTFDPEGLLWYHVSLAHWPSVLKRPWMSHPVLAQWHIDLLPTRGPNSPWWGNCSHTLHRRPRQKQRYRCCIQGPCLGLTVDLLPNANAHCWYLVILAMDWAVVGEQIHPLWPCLDCGHMRTSDSVRLN